MQCHEISLNFVWINQNSYFVKEKESCKVMVLIFSHREIPRSISMGILWMRNTFGFLFRSMLRPMSSDRQKALITAMTKILWQAGGQQHATVVLWVLQIVCYGKCCCSSWFHRKINIWLFVSRYKIQAINSIDWSVSAAILLVIVKRRGQKFTLSLKEKFQTLIKTSFLMSWTWESKIENRTPHLGAQRNR